MAATTTSYYLFPAAGGPTNVPAGVATSTWVAPPATATTSGSPVAGAALATFTAPAASARITLQRVTAGAAVASCSALPAAATGGALVPIPRFPFDVIITTADGSARRWLPRERVESADATLERYGLVS